MQAVDERDLGPFAPEQGPVDGAVALSGALAGGAAAFALARPVAVGLGGDAPWATEATYAAGSLAIVVALIGQYRVVSRATRGRSVARAAIAVSVAAIVGAYLYAGIHEGTLRPDRFGSTFLNREIFGLVWRDLLEGAVNTVKQAFVAELLSIVVGLVFAVFTLSPQRWLRYPAVAYVDVVRALPLILLTMLINFGLPFLGITFPFFTSVVVILTVNASAYVAEIFRAGIQSVPRGQIDAGLSLGMPRQAVTLFVVIPQAFRAVIPPLMSEFIALIKDTALVSFMVGVTVGTAELFVRARFAASSTFSATPFMAAGLLYVLMIVPTARLVGVIERRVRVGL